MANLRIASLVTPVIAACLAVIPNAAEACEPIDMRGRVKSVVETELVADTATGRFGPPRLADRIDFSQDGRTVEMTLYDPQSGKPDLKFITSLENGRPIRSVTVANGRTMPSSNCSYDERGRLVEARTGQDTREFHTLEQFEYSPGFIRRRAQIWGSWYVTTQTLDDNGRIVKEVEVDEAKSTILRITELTYSAGRKEQCSISFMDPRPQRHCVTTIQDSHGNDIEERGEFGSAKITFEYDTIGNWVSRRITKPSGVKGHTIDIIVRRKIEYW